MRIRIRTVVRASISIIAAISFATCAREKSTEAPSGRSSLTKTSSVTKKKESSVNTGRIAVINGVFAFDYPPSAYEGSYTGGTNGGSNTSDNGSLSGGNSYGGSTSSGDGSSSSSSGSYGAGSSGGSTSSGGDGGSSSESMCENDMYKPEDILRTTNGLIVWRPESIPCGQNVPFEEPFLIHGFTIPGNPNKEFQVVCPRIEFTRGMRFLDNGDRTPVPDWRKGFGWIPTQIKWQFGTTNGDAIGEERAIPETDAGPGSKELDQIALGICAGSDGNRGTFANMSLGVRQFSGNPLKYYLMTTTRVSTFQNPVDLPALTFWVVPEISYGHVQNGKYTGEMWISRGSVRHSIEATCAKKKSELDSLNQDIWNGFEKCTAEIKKQCRNGYEESAGCKYYRTTINTKCYENLSAGLIDLVQKADSTLEKAAEAEAYCSSAEVAQIGSLLRHNRDAGWDARATLKGLLGQDSERLRQLEKDLLRAQNLLEATRSCMTGVQKKLFNARYKAVTSAWDKVRIFANTAGGTLPPNPETPKVLSLADMGVWLETGAVDWATGYKPLESGEKQCFAQILESGCSMVSSLFEVKLNTETGNGDYRFLPGNTIGRMLGHGTKEMKAWDDVVDLALGQSEISKLRRREGFIRDFGNMLGTATTWEGLDQLCSAVKDVIGGVQNLADIDEKCIGAAPAGSAAFIKKTKEILDYCDLVKNNKNF